MEKVDHPAHYNAGKIECIDAIEEAVKGLEGDEAFATGNAIKYLWRWKPSEVQRCRMPQSSRLFQPHALTYP